MFEDTKRISEQQIFECVVIHRLEQTGAGWI